MTRTTAIRTVRAYRRATLPHAARRSCSSSEIGSMPNASRAGAGSPTLSPASSIVSWSRVIGGARQAARSTAAPGRGERDRHVHLAAALPERCGRSARRARSRSPRRGRRGRRSGSPPPAGRPRPRSSAATSSTQIGWSRRSPLPSTGVTGDQRTCRTKSGRTPPSRPKTKLGRKTTCSSPSRGLPAPSPTSPRSTGRAFFVCSETPSALISTNRRTPAAFAAATSVLRPSVHHALEVRRAAGDDRDQVDDRVAAVRGPPQALRVGHVALHELAAPCLQRPGAAGLADEARTSRSWARSACTTFGPTNPVPPVTRITSGSSPVAARRRALLALVLRAEAVAAVGRGRRLGQLDERELADLHAVVDRDRQVGDVRELERHVAVPARVDEAGGRVDQEPEPPQTRLSLQAGDEVVRQLARARASSRARTRPGGG